jgi:hypothetical protein
MRASIMIHATASRNPLDLEALEVGERALFAASNPFKLLTSFCSSGSCERKLQLD